MNRRGCNDHRYSTKHYEEPKEIEPDFYELGPDKPVKNKWLLTHIHKIKDKPRIHKRC